MNRLSGTLADVLNEVIDSLSQVEEDIIDAALHRLAAYEDTGLTPEEIAELRKAHNRQYETLAFLLTEADGVETQHLRDLLIAEHEGRLVVLPCKVGDTVWLLDKKCKHAGEDNKPWNSCDQYWNNVRTKGMWGCAGKDDEGNTFHCEKREIVRYAKPMAYSLVLCAPHIVPGKNLFLTLEEAEAALKGGAG